jgi:hypothetical protein
VARKQGKECRGKRTQQEEEGEKGKGEKKRERVPV